MITVAITFNEFVEFPPHLSMYLISVKLVENQIPLEINLTDILIPPKLLTGSLVVIEDFDKQIVTYTWNPSNESE
ncbi:hypothetical protein GD1_57 [Paraglaciecola Antarctic GD virus 1]|nr:hypothetical protein GD1_57 [Paraglaciecola Antarctic GD virus 1]